jgi:hypothetical protein
MGESQAVSNNFITVEGFTYADEGFLEISHVGSATA